MTKDFSIEEFVAKVQTVAQKVEPLLKVSQAGPEVCVVEYPGLRNQVWVQAASEGEKFQVYKAAHQAPQPTHLKRLSPVGETFLGEVLKNYVSEVGNPHME